MLTRASVTAAQPGLLPIKSSSTIYRIQQLDQTDYPETQALLKVHGVGYITVLTFGLTFGRDVGCCYRDPQLGITKAGNASMVALQYGLDSFREHWFQLEGTSGAEPGAR